MHHRSKVEIFTVLDHSGKFRHQDFPKGHASLDLRLRAFAGQRVAVAKHVSFEAVVGLEVFETVDALVETEVEVAALDVQLQFVGSA